MTKIVKDGPLKFEKAMEINGISPLPHYFEEIYTNQVGLKKLGIRGDRNYLFYSENGFGAGYYEETEKRLAAASVYEFFAKPGSREKLFTGIKAIITRLNIKAAEVNALDLNSLSIQQLAQLFLEANTLHGEIFSYFVVSQPYRIARFEDQLRSELTKRVAESRIDAYMTQLATSNAPTKITYEEIDWLKFVIKYKKKYNQGKLKIDTLESDLPDLYRDLLRHYEEYKILTLGDGNWDYDLKSYFDKLQEDWPKDLISLKQRHQKIANHQKHAQARRNELITELYLDDKTVQIMDFLAELGHTRLTMRIEGWVPFIATIIKIDIALSTALDLGTAKLPLLNYVLPDELAELARTGKLPVTEAEILERRGKDQKFLILHDHGVFRIFYGEAAREKFEELVPPIDHEITTELRGATAVRGVITGTVCVYQWGDDIRAKLEIIRKHPILVAGQTRPSMMPIIRLAKGIVTDEGGITSHAAIVSRELGIPSVIGTIYATRVFKDGDLVELDADHGIVRKLS